MSTQTIETPEKKVTYDIDSLFKDSKEIISSQRLHCLFWGGPGVGKTYAGLTFPSPIYVIDTDGGTALNLKYFKDKKIVVIEAYEAVTNPATTAGGSTLDAPFDVDPLINLEKFDAITKRLSEMPEVKGGTIIIDTITDIWSWIGTWLSHKTAKQVSKGGSEYMSRFAWGDANNRYDWIMKRLKQLDANLVLIARSKAVYDSTGNITSENKADAQKNTASYVDFFVELKKTFNKTNEGMKTERVAVITKSRGMDITDPLVKDFSYQKLRSLIDQTH